MRYQALALDLDGTLTNSKKEVTPATRAALGRAMFEGCKVILASGRPLVGIQPVAWALGLPRLGGYILAYNGGQVVDCRTGETLRQDRLDPAQIRRLCEFARQQGVSILTYDRDGIVTEHPEDPFVQKEAGINRIPVQKVPDLAAYVTYPITKMLLVGEPERMAAVDADGGLRGGVRVRVQCAHTVRVGVGVGFVRQCGVVLGHEQLERLQRCAADGVGHGAFNATLLDAGVHNFACVVGQA